MHIRRILLLTLVALNMTIVCQGHDVIDTNGMPIGHHSTPHIAFFGEPDDENAPAHDAPEYSRAVEASAAPKRAEQGICLREAGGHGRYFDVRQAGVAYAKAAGELSSLIELPVAFWGITPADGVVQRLPVVQTATTAEHDAPIPEAPPPKNILGYIAKSYFTS